MFKPSRTLSLVLASSVALSMIVLAYLFSGPFSLSPSLAEAQTADALLKAYAAKDSDSDGLPDWQESLYGTDPANPESVKAGMSDSDAVAQGLVSLKFSSDTSGLSATDGTNVPGTAVSDNSLTAQFSQAFFKAYVAAGGENMADADKQKLLSTLMADFSARAQKLVLSPYTITQVHTDTSVSLETYAGSVERILTDNDVRAGEAEPLPLMEALIQNGDESARPKLARLAASYAAIAKALAALAVPPQAAAEHVTITQSFDTLARATSIAAAFEKDPIAVLGALSIYQPSADAMIKAFVSLADKLIRNGEPASGAPGALIVNIGRTAHAQ